MQMKVHELHPSMVHAPLALLPTAALAEIGAALHPHRRDLPILRALWWTTAVSGLFTGLAGMAASQEVKTGGKHADDMMWLHGIGNVALVGGALGIAIWRARHRPSLAVGIGGLVASTVALYTAWLGGQMVYHHGLGVKTLAPSLGAGVKPDVPALLSRRAPGRLLRDALAGLTWLFKRGLRAARGIEPVERTALGFQPGHRVEIQTPTAPL